MKNIAGIEELRAAGYVGYENGEFVKGTARARPKHKSLYEMILEYKRRVTEAWGHECT